MRRRAAAGGSAVFLLVAPGTVVGLLPWRVTGWDTDVRHGSVLRVVGAGLIAMGVVVLAHTFVGFVREGGGTPAPVAPTERLVVGGLYRFVRNPMYLAVIAAVVGQALVLGQAVLWWYAIVVAVAVVTFVQLYEEPVLAARHGDDYERYRREVPGWWPRLRARPADR